MISLSSVALQGETENAQGKRCFSLEEYEKEVVPAHRRQRKDYGIQDT